MSGPVDVSMMGPYVGLSSTAGECRRRCGARFFCEVLREAAREYLPARVS